METSTLLLAHWTYTRDEWKTFLRWRMRKRGILRYMWYRFSPMTRKLVPEVKITEAHVWIGTEHRPFSTSQHQLRRINIRDEGAMNIMEFTYEL